MTGIVRAIAIVVACAAGAAGAAGADSDGSPEPAAVGVRVEKPAGDGVHFAQGSGVYLGDGLVITAAHVIEYDPGHAAVTVLLDGTRTPGAVVFDGERQAKPPVDLALIRVATEYLPPARIVQPEVRPCPANPATGQAVTVAALGTVSQSATLPTPLYREGATALTTQGGWTNILVTGYHPGNSGGGVFDPRARCLWGILNLELSGTPAGGARPLDLTAFVPATEIAAFMGDYRRAQAARSDDRPR